MGALWNVRALRNVTERCWSILGCCRALQNITERCVPLRAITGALWSSYGMLWKKSILPITKLNF